MKLKLTLFTLIISLSSVSGQTTFNQKVVVNETFITANASYTYVVDIDGDGDKDVIAGGTDLNWYENLDGLGSFEQKTVISTNTFPIYIYAADIDNDNDMDIIHSSKNGSNLFWYENTDGNGDFQLIEEISPGAGSSQTLPVFLADIDGDIDLDIVTSYNASFPSERKLIWYENTDGNGSFSSEKIISLEVGAQRTTFIIAKDVDNDNKIDIISASYNDDKIFWHRNIDGVGTFSNEQEITEIADGVNFLYTIDIDNDGDIDVLSTSENDNKIAWYKNLDGNGNFSVQKIINGEANNAKSVSATDVDNDGYIDVISTFSSNEVAWYKNINGVGGFGTKQIITTKSHGVKHITHGDLDSDGNIDVISASSDDDKVAWYKNTNGNGNFSSQISISRITKYLTNVYSADLDGDGDNDIISTSYNDAKIAWYENIDSKGFFGNQQIIIEKVGTGNGSPQISLKDLDNDGDFDIVAYIPAANNIPRKLIWFENNGLGVFSIEHLISNSLFPTYIRIADLDNDGDNDMVLGYYSSKKITWLENIDGNGISFGVEQVIYTSPLVVNDLEVSDLDNDGDIDLISSFDSSRVKWFENTNGNFTTHSLNIGEVGDINISDMDGDSDMDIVALAENSSFNDVLSWYENDGTGNFNTEHFINTQQELLLGNQVLTADIDNDGDIDVITALGSSQQTNGKLTLFENLGGLSNFSTGQIIEEDSNAYAYSACVSDINGDNKIDIGLYQPFLTLNCILIIVFI